MQNQDATSFDDPALKAALRRNFAGQCAPSHLRDRICRCLASKDAPSAPLGVAPGGMRLSPVSSGPLILPSLLPGLAMAAAMVIAIGAIALILSTSSQAVPLNFQTAAIARHDGCCKAPDHHDPRLPPAGFPRIGQYLRQELNHPVLAADLTQDGWAFAGAAICPVSGVPSAHLLFRKGDETLSVFSLPASSIPSLANHQTLESTTPDGHTIVARSENGAIYCLVGQCPQGELTCDDLDHLLNQHAPQATVAATPGPRITLAGILREP